MLLWQKILIGYLIAINIVTFIIYAADKIKAMRGEWRVRESLLLILSFIGGSLGAVLGMGLCRHKIRKWYFAIGVPIMLIAHLALCIVIYLKFFR